MSQSRANQESTTVWSRHGIWQMSAESKSDTDGIQQIQQTNLGKQALAVSME